MRIVRVEDVRLPLLDQPRELPPGPQIELAVAADRHGLDLGAGAAKQFALGMRDEHDTMAARLLPERRQERLVLSASPGLRGVDVDDEHVCCLSQIFANFRKT